MEVPILNELDKTWEKNRKAKSGVYTMHIENSQSFYYNSGALSCAAILDTSLNASGC